MSKTNTPKSGRKPSSKTDHKYQRGVVAVVAGSPQFPGAALLAVGGARRGGAGYVKFVGKTESLNHLVVSQFPDVVPIKNLVNQRVDALVVGPGVVLIKKLPQVSRIVLDSTALKLALNNAKSNDKDKIIVVTPHEGELKLLGYPKPVSITERSKIAQQIADDLNVVVVLKGNKTVIAAPMQKLIIDRIGGPELATAGSGDVLAGLIGAFLASWRPDDLKSAQRVVAAAVNLHSRAGAVAARKYSCVVATDLLESLAYC